MIDTDRIEIDIKNIESLVSNYIQLNFSPNSPEKIQSSCSTPHSEQSGIIGKLNRSNTEVFDFLKPQRIIGGLYRSNADSFNFLDLFKKNGDESFSQMLLRLIDESGESNANVYNRANIDRRHFSKIVKHDDYQPSKQTVLAFAIALKLGFDKTKALLASAGFTLSNSNLADVIVSAFIENKIFDINLVNQILYKYDQPLLGS